MHAATVSVLALAAVLVSGCIELTTADVRFRKAEGVALTTAAGAPVLEATPDAKTGDAQIDRGHYWYFFSQKPYETRATRAESGAISIRCDACSATPYGYRASGPVELLDESGHARPTLAALVDHGPSSISVGYDLCMLHGGKSCRVGAKLNLMAPASEVLEVRRRTEPVRIWGYTLTGMSAILLVVGTIVLFAPSPAGRTIGERAPWAAATLVPGITFGSLGLWHILQPAKDQIWRPQ